MNSAAMPMRGFRDQLARRLTQAPYRQRLRYNFNGSEALRNRWFILAVLFVVRLTMAFSFKASPRLRRCSAANSALDLPMWES